MADNTVYISAEGLEKLKADLADLYKRRIAVAATIEFARGLGDLSENAEYHAAKEEQALVHAYIRDLEDKIARSALLTTSNRDLDKVFLGATVRVKNHKMGKEQVYLLVDPAEADIMSGKISTQSPVGKALLGKAVGDEATAQTPAGPMTLTVLEITY